MHKLYSLVNNDTGRSLYSSIAQSVSNPMKDVRQTKHDHIHYCCCTQFSTEIIYSYGKHLHVELDPQKHLITHGS